MLQSRRYRSWGYEVKNGATTIWERWNSYTEEHGFGGPNGKMNAATEPRTLEPRDHRFEVKSGS
jgi:hypothetical protein